jgi:predicted PurR-regulated permease PerM
VLGIVIGVIWLLGVARPILTPLVIALLLSYFLVPPINLLSKWLRMKRIWALNIVYALFLVILFSIPATAGTVVVRWVSELELDLQTAVTVLANQFSEPVAVFGYEFQPSGLISNLDEAFNRFLSALPGGAVNVLANVSTNLLWGIVILVATYYFLAEGPNIRRMVALPPAYQPEYDRLLEEINKAWKSFLWGQVLVFLIMFLPTVGSVYGVIWLYQIGLLKLSPIGLVVVVIVVYTLVQQIDTIWLRPQLFGESLKIHPALILIGLVGGLTAGGLLGVIIVVPAMATIKVVARYVHRKLQGLPAWPDMEPTAPAPSEPAQSEEQMGAMPITSQEPASATDPGPES